MSGALRVLRAELVRMLGSRAAWIGAALILAVPALRIWAASFAQRAKALASYHETCTTGWCGCSSTVLSRRRKNEDFSKDLF